MIEKYTADIIKGKETKFLRDQSAHEGGYAYKWNSKAQPRHFPRETNYTPPNVDNIILNISSTSPILSGQSTWYRDLSEDRLPKKKKKQGNSDAQSLESFKRTFGMTQNRTPPGHARSIQSQSPMSQHSLSNIVSGTFAPVLTTDLNASSSARVLPCISNKVGSLNTMLFTTNSSQLDPKLAPIFLGKVQEMGLSPLLYTLPQQLGEKPNLK